STDKPKWLEHSLNSTPIFVSGVYGFQKANADPSVASGGDGRPAGFVPCGGTGSAWQNCPGSSSLYPALQWAGKREFTDPQTQIKYVTLVELYDEDDPLSLQYDAWQGSVTYPAGFVSSVTTPNAGIYVPGTPDPNSSSMDSACGLNGTSGLECPGNSPGRSFSSVNQDFNNRVAVRATGRLMKNYSGQWHVLS